MEDQEIKIKYIFNIEKNVNIKDFFDPKYCLFGFFMKNVFL